MKKIFLSNLCHFPPSEREQLDVATPENKCSVLPIESDKKLFRFQIIPAPLLTALDLLETY